EQKINGVDIGDREVTGSIPTTGAFPPKKRPRQRLYNSRPSMKISQNKGSGYETTMDYN
ncbi:hypothetical protein DPMN_011923, partial [Dreissena polymorpha]